MEVEEGHGSNADDEDQVGDEIKKERDEPSTSRKPKVEKDVSFTSVRDTEHRGSIHLTDTLKPDAQKLVLLRLSKNTWLVY